VQCQPAIGAVRVTPVDDVDILAQREQVLHQRAVILQVHHVRAVDQCVADQQWRLRGRLAFALVAIHDDLVFGVDRFLVGGAVVDVFHFTQRLETCREFLLGAHGLVQRALRIDADGFHRDYSLAADLADLRDTALFGARAACSAAGLLPAFKRSTSARSAATSATSSGSTSAWFFASRCSACRRLPMLSISVRVGMPRSVATRSTSFCTFWRTRICALTTAP